MFGDPTMNKSFGGQTNMQIAYRKVDACFELMDKLAVDYFCFHDRDIAPEGATLAESNANLAEIAEYIAKKQAETGKKCLWGTSNLFNNPASCMALHGSECGCLRVRSRANQAKYRSVY
jgi:xylose isomerase